MGNKFPTYLENQLIINSKYYIPLFLLWPFLAFVTALTTYDKRESKNVVLLFFIYYGLSFVITNPGTDSAEYARRLAENAKLPFSDVFKILGGIYTSETSVDIVEPLISFIASRFSSNYSLYFALWSALFGFFYIKSINLLYNRYVDNPNWDSRIMLFFFLMTIPITEMNGPRMWTASWVFFYGAYHVVMKRDPRYFFISLGASLIHFSFITSNAVLLIYFLAGNRNFIFIPLAIASFIVPHLAAPYFESLSQNLGGGLLGRYEAYTNEAYVLERQELYSQTIWFMKIGRDLVFYFLIIAIAVIGYSTRKIEKTEGERNLFSFLLLFLSFVNFGKAIPSFGSRFQVIFLMFASLYVFLYFVQRKSKGISFLSFAGLFPILLYAAIEFRQGSDTINTWLLLPGLGLPQFVPGIALSSFLFN